MTVVLLCAGAIVHSDLVAQPLLPAAGGGDRKLIDGVAAVVGTEVILISDVVQRAFVMAQQNQGKVDPNDPAFLRELLSEVIDEKLMLTRAREDSITIPEEEINRQVEFRLQQLIQQAGSEQRLEQAYQMSIDQIRREARDIIRPSLLIRRLADTKFANLKVNDLDLKEFYSIYKDSLPAIPDQVELQHIVVKVKPSPEVVAQTEALARAIIDSIKAGGDFADFARRYSSDPGSAKEGGDLGWVNYGQFVPEYDAATRKLELNEISDPIRSDYGIHIIQVLNKRDDAVNSRHILLKLKPGDGERDSAIALLKSLRERALGGESFADLARKYSEDETTKGLGGALGKTPPDKLPTDLAKTVSTLSPGEITEPLSVALTPTETGYHIVRLVRRVPAHPLDPEEDRAQLEQLAMQYKQSKELKKWLAELRKEIYWDIKVAEFK